MEWNNEKVVELLEQLQNEPCLWDPKNEYYKNYQLKNDAWQRLTESLPFEVTVEDLKKKKNSLMSYYKKQLNKFTHSLHESSSSGTDVFMPKWFAYEIMDSFLGEVYGSLTSNTKISEVDAAQERSEEEAEEETDGELEEDPLLPETDRTENKSSQNLNFTSSKKSQLNDNWVVKPEVKQEIKTSLQVNEAIDNTQVYERESSLIKEKEDEYDLFGRIIALKLRNIKNAESRDVLMNDISNLIFSKCMKDRKLEKSNKQSVVTKSFWSKTDPFWSLVRTTMTQIFYFSLQAIKKLVQSEEDITTEVPF